MAALNTYSALDRALHRLAFNNPSVQLAAADIEDKLFARAFAAADASAPIFITSLPRAGTTVLLEALSSLPELAAHVYRDMPFVMAPLLWARMSGGFQKKADLNERAHGDGVMIGYDSPEAFEEVIWRAFWPSKFHDDRIELWRASDADEEAQAFFITHMRKIITLRCGEDAAAGRYISKNNANIARIELIKAMFPDGTIIVPVRDPITHAASLFRQHKNFIAIHAEDRFARRYMADIGHYEFGELHRPIAFPLFSELAGELDPLSLDYWLAYWIAAFEHIRAEREHVHVVAYERLCSDPVGALGGIAAAAHLRLDDRLDSIAAHFHAVPTRGEDVDVSDDLRRRAEELYRRLVEPSGSAASSSPAAAGARSPGP